MTQPSDTAAWNLQVWAAFVLAMGGSILGIAYAPIDMWMRGFFAMSYLFTVSSCFALAKTVRDKQERQQLASKIEQAQAEHYLKSAASDTFLNAA